MTRGISYGLFTPFRVTPPRVGGLFGPIMVGWFLVIAALGIVWLLEIPWQGSTLNRFLEEVRDAAVQVVPFDQ